jgi:hypothetical protein
LPWRAGFLDRGKPALYYGPRGAAVKLWGGIGKRLGVKLD